jgi:site-specific recombinase XerD
MTERKKVKAGQVVRKITPGRRLSKAAAPGYHAGRVPVNKGHSFPAEPLSGDEVRALLKAASTRGSSGLRNRALVVVMWRAGLRVSEALALFPKDVDAKAGTVAVLHGKGDKRRTVAMDPEAFAVLERWLDRRGELGIAGRSPVFCTLKGGALRTSYVRAWLGRVAKKAGLEKRIHAHGLRHTFAVELMREGVPLNVISAALGHSNLATTSRYLSHIAPREVIETLRGRTW